MSDANTLAPTWGYRPDGSAQIFDLEPGAGLPEGWHATPDCIEDRSLATAEALTDAAARAAKAAERRPVTASTTSTAPATLAPAMAEENARLKAENAGLIADLAAARERVAGLSAELEQVRAAAPAAAGFGDGAAAPLPQVADEQLAEPVQSGQAARTREEAREAVRALLDGTLTDREIARRVGVSPSTVAGVRKSLP